MARTVGPRRQHPIIDALISKRNVMNAVILRDMRTRFFNHGLGFLVVPLWPFVHMAILIAVHSLTARSSPFGESAPLFYATGLVPTLAFIYVSRYMAYSLVMNRPMLAFPVVKVLDVMFGRAFLEIIAAFATLAAIMLVLWCSGDDPMPNNLEWAVCAYLATLLLAVGFGTLVGIGAMFIPIITTVYQLVIIVLYISSGVMFVASNLPEQVGYIASFNPVLECVEWMRTAYYESYSDKLVHPEYVLSFGGICLLAGLILDRFLRRKMLEG